MVNRKPGLRVSNWAAMERAKLCLWIHWYANKIQIGMRWGRGNLLLWIFREILALLNWKEPHCGSTKKCQPATGLRKEDGNHNTRKAAQSRWMIKRCSQHCLNVCFRFSNLLLTSSFSLVYNLVVFWSNAVRFVKSQSVDIPTTLA